MAGYDRKGNQLARLHGMLREGGGTLEGLSWSAVNLFSRPPSTGVGVRASAANPPSYSWAWFRGGPAPVPGGSGPVPSSCHLTFELA